MPKANKIDSGKLECPACDGRINLHGKEPEFGDTYLCPDCHVRWKMIKDAFIYMRMVKIEPEHKCPSTNDPLVKYCDSNDYWLPNEKSGWYIDDDRNESHLIKVDYCPHCGEKLKDDPNFVSVLSDLPQDLTINRVQALEL